MLEDFDLALEELPLKTRSLLLDLFNEDVFQRCLLLQESVFFC